MKFTLQLMRIAGATIFGFLFGGRILPAQVPKTSLLSSKHTEFPVGFSSISAIIELRDGRVLVVDDLERSVHVLHFDSGSSERVGRIGRGPLEYVLPSRLYQIGADTVILLEKASTRNALALVDARPVAAFRFSDEGVRVGTPQALDLSGRMYAVGRRIVNADGQLADSVAIERWERGTAKRDTLGYLILSSAARSSRAVGRSGAIARPAVQPAFEEATEWCVSQDGAVNLVQSSPYRLVIINDSGGRVEGPEIAPSRISVSNAHKAAWIQDRTQPALMARQGSDGSTTYELRKPVPPRAVDWPDQLPPFLAGATTCAPDGSVWVKRTTVTVDSSKYDVFDRSGRRVREVLIPDNGRLAGFGAKAFYVIRTDADDVKYLRRYARE